MGRRTSETEGGASCIARLRRSKTGRFVYTDFAKIQAAPPSFSFADPILPRPGDTPTRRSVIPATLVVFRQSRCRNLRIFFEADHSGSRCRRRRSVPLCFFDPGQTVDGSLDRPSSVLVLDLSTSLAIGAIPASTEVEDENGDEDDDDPGDTNTAQNTYQASALTFIDNLSPDCCM